jgi:hypothetical protein
MGVCFRVVSDDRMFLFSLVKWGVIRKFLSKIFKANPYKFTPSYELAIYDKTEGKVHFGHPYFYFHFANKEIANMRMEMIKELFEEGIQGIVKVCELVPTFDSEKEGMYEGPSEFLNWEISRRKKGRFM